MKKTEIKIRLTLEQKDLIKRVAKAEKTTMSEFILSHIEPIALQKEEKIKNKETIEERIEATEGKIQELKGKLEKKQGNKNWFKKIINK